MQRVITIKHPFRMLVSGRSGSGKTFTTIKFIKKFVIPQVSRIVAMIPTFGQPLYRQLDQYIEEGNLYKELTDEALLTVEREQNEGDTKTLLLIDDASASRNLHVGGRKGIFDRLVFNARHLDLSLIVISQNITTVSPSLRDNMEYVMVFFTLNKKELKYYNEELSWRPNEFIKHYYAAISGEDGRPMPYAFLFARLSVPVEYYSCLEHRVVVT